MKNKMWTKLRPVLNNSEKHKAMTAIAEGTKAEFQCSSATNLGQ
jgi:hypothetical protein